MDEPSAVRAPKGPEVRRPGVHPGLFRNHQCVKWRTGTWASREALAAEEHDRRPDEDAQVEPQRGVADVPFVGQFLLHIGMEAGFLEQIPPRGIFGGFVRFEVPAREHQADTAWPVLPRRRRKC